MIKRDNCKREIRRYQCSAMTSPRPTLTSIKQCLSQITSKQYLNQLSKLSPLQTRQNSSSFRNLRTWERSSRSSLTKSAAWNRTMKRKWPRWVRSFNTIKRSSARRCVSYWHSVGNNSGNLKKSTKRGIWSWNKWRGKTLGSSRWFNLRCWCIRTGRIPGGHILCTCLHLNPRIG
jgi:hypothetical protein